MILSQIDGIWSYRWLVTEYDNPAVLIRMPESVLADSSRRASLSQTCREFVAETFMLGFVPFVVQVQDFEMLE